MNKKISQFDELNLLTTGLYIPVVRNNLNYRFDIAYLKTFITKADIGLGDADNTSDVNKPISLAVQSALSAINVTLSYKAAIGHLHQMSEITGLIDHFAGYSRINHRHNVTDIDGLSLPNMSLYATIQDMLLRTTEPRVLELIAQNSTGGVDLGPINARVDALALRMGTAENGISQNTGNITVHANILTTLDQRVTALENALLNINGGPVVQQMNMVFPHEISYYRLNEQEMYLGWYQLRPKRLLSMTVNVLSHTPTNPPYEYLSLADYQTAMAQQSLPTTEPDPTTVTVTVDGTDIYTAVLPAFQLFSYETFEASKDISANSVITLHMSPYNGVLLGHAMINVTFEWTDDANLIGGY